MDSAVFPSLSPKERPPAVGTFVQVWGRQVHVLSQGSGHPVVVLHGTGSVAEEILSALGTVPGLRLIAPDRPGFGLSEALPEDALDPQSLARWLNDLLTALGLARVRLVAHSLGAGMAVILAWRWPDRVEHLILLAPFCRPTPQRLMIGLRLANAPVVGGFIRAHVVPTLVRLSRRWLPRAFMAPNRPPPWVHDLPFTHIAQPSAIKTMGAELLRFNKGMRRVQRRVRLGVPVTVVQGVQDETAKVDWHLPWLRARAPILRVVLVPDCAAPVRPTDNRGAPWWTNPARPTRVHSLTARPTAHRTAIGGMTRRALRAMFRPRMPPRTRKSRRGWPLHWPQCGT